MEVSTARKTARRSGWSPARRESQATAIRRWKPWQRSTGPRTLRGKAISAQNAVTHGYYNRAFAPLLAALTRQREFLNRLTRIHCLRRQFRKTNYWREAGTRSASRRPPLRLRSPPRSVVINLAKNGGLTVKINAYDRQRP